MIKPIEIIEEVEDWERLENGEGLNKWLSSWRGILSPRLPESYPCIVRRVDNEPRFHYVSDVRAMAEAMGLEVRERDA